MEYNSAICLPSIPYNYNQVAPCYYAASLKSAIALGHEKYYTKDAWHPPPTLYHLSNSPNNATQMP